MKASLTLSCVVLSLLCVTKTLYAQDYLDTSFNPGTGANGLVESTVVQPDGKILICGNFTSFNNTSHAYIARLNADGSVDETFNADVGYWVRHMALQSDGKIVIGGFFTNVGGVSRNRIARLNSDGTLDTSFNPGTGCQIKIVPPDPWDPFVFAVGVQPDGKILIAGNFVTYNGSTNVGLVRVNSDGSRDTNFNVGAGINSWARSLLIQPNGQIMLTGWFTSYNNHFHSRMVLLNPDGSDDQTFNPNFGELTAVYTVAQIGGGKYIVAGHSANTNNPGYFEREMARLNPDGSFDTTFLGYANEKVESIKIQSDGKIVMGGYFSEVNGVRRWNLARLNADGSLDESFAPQADNYVWTLALQGDGRIVATGGFSTINGVSRNGVARLTTSPSANSSMPFDIYFQGANSRVLRWSGDTSVTKTLYNSGHAMFPANRLAAVADFNHDAKPDFVWQHNTRGTVSIWLMNDTNVISTTTVSNQLPTGARVVAAADFNGDGETDILLQKGMNLTFWFMNGTQVTSTMTISKPNAAAWRVAGAADVDLDGKADVLWQHPAGFLAVTKFDGGTLQPGTKLTKRVPAGWVVRGFHDISGDGKPDVLFQSSSGPLVVWYLDGTTFSFSAIKGRVSPTWRVVGIN